MKAPSEPVISADTSGDGDRFEDMIVRAALAGFGLAFVMEGDVAEHLASGRLAPVLQDWCPPFPGYFLYYPSRRQPSAVFALLVEALRHRA